MRTKQFRVYGFNAMVGIAVVVALLLALQMSLAQAQEIIQGDDDPNKMSYYVGIDTERDYSCDPGATGNCSVEYVALWQLTEEQHQATCGLDFCYVRIEVRW